MAPQEPPLDPPLLNYVGGLHMIVPLIVFARGISLFPHGASQDVPVKL